MPRPRGPAPAVILMLALVATPALRGETGKASSEFRAEVGATEVSHGDPGAGRRILLEKKCLACHCVLGKGGVSAPDIGKLGGAYTYFQLVGLMWGHSPRMMETAQKMGMTWPKFEPSEMEDITAYLHSVGETQELGNVAAGERLFEHVCVLCHSVGGRGASIGPHLDFLARSPSGVEMAMAMWNHGTSMSSTMRVKGVQRPVLGDEDVANLMAYIRARSRDTSNVRYSPMGDPAAGREVFFKTGCATCHGRDGRGGVGPDLAAAGPRGVARIAAKLWNHAPAMIETMKKVDVPVPVLDVVQAGDLMAFLGFLGYVDAKPDLLHGKALYAEKGCIECHGRPGKHDGSGPDLAGVDALKTRGGVASTMWNHAPAMAAAVATQRAQLSWPRFVENEMRDLIGYLAHMASGGAEPEAPRPLPAPSPGASPTPVPSQRSWAPSPDASAPPPPEPGSGSAPAGEASLAPRDATSVTPPSSPSAGGHAPAVSPSASASPQHPGTPKMRKKR